MRIELKLGLASAALIASLAFAGASQAAPVAGLSAIEAAQPASDRPLVEKAHYTGHPHTHHHHYHHHHHHG
ncbi:hypothetical protein [Methylocapsa acidiphila]|uniref:hypothetical protein n=1 Tax=Methylocapsa acidiphila TaxID=133552 RepID=UPI000414AA5D|nr:hypothetical protein [Methylocapsa acidiphila]